MAYYLLRRFLLIIPVLIGVSFLTFGLIRITPGDPVTLMLGTDATPELVEATRQQLGLNEPVLVQYGIFLWRALHGNLGNSIHSDAPVLKEILERFPYTLQLTLAAMLFAIPVGVTIGMLAAITRGKPISSVLMVGALFGLSIPGFWLAILFVLTFGLQLRWVSVIGGTTPKDLILPALALGLGPAAVLARLSRSCMLEVLNEDYVRTARAKGLQERLVIARHVLRNALIPVVTVMGLQFASMLGGALFIESVFGRPGLGRYAVDAIQTRDFPAIQGMVLFTAVVYVLINLCVDLFYAVLDPRISYT